MSNGINKNWSLIGKYLNGEATLSEKTEVEKELATSDESRKEFEKSKQMLVKIDAYYLSEKFDSSKAWSKIYPVLQPEVPGTKHLEKEKIRLFQKFYKYAAVIIIVLTLGFVVFYTINQSNPEYIEITTAKNQVLKNYLLPDGSNVTLNKGTELKYAKSFKNNLREIFITGEAFFDVIPNSEKPFVIHAGDAMITVLGTSFNVCAYPEDEMVEVLVETGKVHVMQDNLDTSEHKSEVFLNAGEKGTLLIAENTIEKSINTDKNLLAWKTGILVFSETPLFQVIKYLQKVYHIKIDVKQNEINNLVLTARFDEKPVEFILEVLRLTFNLDLSEESDRYILSKKLEPEKI